MEPNANVEIKSTSAFHNSLLMKIKKGIKDEYDSALKNETYTRHKKYEIDHSKLPAPKKYKDLMSEKFETKEDERHRKDPEVEKVNNVVIRNEMLEHFEN